MRSKDVAAPAATAWTADRIAAEAYRVVAGVIRGDREELRRLVKGYVQERARMRSSIPLPADPWTNSAVVYGAMLTLAQIADTGAKSAISPNTMADLIDNSEACNLLLAIGAEPNGIMLQADIPAETGLARSNAHPQIRRLTDLGLFARRAADRDSRVYSLELTRQGWLVAEVLRRLGFSHQSPHLSDILTSNAASVSSIVRALRSRISSMHDAIAAGREMAESATSAPVRHRISRTLAQALRDLEPSAGAGLFLAFLDSSCERLRGKSPLKHWKIDVYFVEGKSEVFDASEVFHKLYGDIARTSWLRPAVKAWDARLTEDPEIVKDAIVRTAEELVKSGSQSQELAKSGVQSK